MGSIGYFTHAQLFLQWWLILPIVESNVKMIEQRYCMHIHIASLQPTVYCFTLHTQDSYEYAWCMFNNSPNDSVSSMNEELLAFILCMIREMCFQATM
jgi:hypothetical protein